MTILLTKHFTELDERDAWGIIRFYLFRDGCLVRVIKNRLKY